MTALLSDKRINHIRTRVLGMLPDRYSVLPLTRTITTPSGSVMEVEGPPVQYKGAVLIPCRLDLSRHARPELIFDQEVVVDEFELYAPWDAPLWVDAKIQVFSDLTSTGRKYEVRKVANNSRWTFLQFALVSEVVTGADNV